MNMIPKFIEDKFYLKSYSGNMLAYAVFMDIVGFTKITEMLMSKAAQQNNLRAAGAETLSNIINRAMSFMIN